MGRHGDTLEELVTVCTGCHTSKNHQEGGALYGLEVKHARLENAAYMNIVRWYIVNTLQKDLAESGIEFNHCYGDKTAYVRKELALEKTHANDAYCIGEMRPAVRAKTQYHKKRRRNNRVLEKNYDKRVVDTRTGEIVKGAQIGTNRTNRRENRIAKSERCYRGKTVKKGYRSIRRTRYAIQSGDTVLYNKKRYPSNGVHCNGKRVLLGKKSVAISKVKVIKNVGGWIYTT